MLRLWKYGKYVLLLLVVLLGLMHGAMWYMSMSEGNTRAYFEKEQVAYTMRSVDLGGTSVNVLKTGDGQEGKPLLVFVHGAPGSWDAWKSFMTDSALLRRAHMLAYDRPGYGLSSNTSMPSITSQADILAQIIHQEGAAKNIVVGHSYGGPIIGKLMASHPDLVDAAILVAPVNDPVSEPVKWYAYPPYWKLTRWLFPKPFQVASDEKLAHVNELYAMEDDWSSIRSKVIHIHGMDDGLAPAEGNINWSKNHISSDHLELVKLDGKGHLIIWSEHDLIRDVIVKELE